MRGRTGITTALIGALVLAVSGLAGGASARIDAPSDEQPRLDGEVFFRAYDDTHGYELWKSDGTKPGTKLVKDIAPEGVAASYPEGFMRLGKVVLFRAFDGDETGQHGYELFKTNGTAAGTKLVKDINTGTPGSDPRSIARFGKIAIFEAYDEGHGSEVWRTDGTKQGTKLVKDIYAGIGMGSSPSGFIKLGRFMYFSAYDPDAGRELWRTDGTKNGTKLVKNIAPGSESANPFAFGKLGKRIYFGATGDLDDGQELWTSDGTKKGTKFVKDIYSGPSSSMPIEFTRLGGELLFRAQDEDHGNELWRTDGTKRGTKLVEDIDPDGDGYPFGLVRLGKHVIFAASDGFDVGEHSSEIWRSDGTKQGTKLVKDIYPGTSGSYPCGFAVLGKRVLFGAYNEEFNNELWESDGTKKGTKLLKDIRPGGDDGADPFGCD